MPQALYSIIDNYFTEQVFKRSKIELVLYMNIEGTNNILIISLYVDDLIYTRNNEKIIEDFKKDMIKMFEMIDLRLIHYFLRIEINQQEDGIYHSK